MSTSHTSSPLDSHDSSAPRTPSLTVQADRALVRSGARSTRYALATSSRRPRRAATRAFR